MDFAFKKKNYILLIVGFAFIAAGLIALAGGEAEDPTKLFTEEDAGIFNFQRWTVAPILLATGFIIEIFAVMYKGKDF